MLLATVALPWLADKPPLPVWLALGAAAALYLAASPAVRALTLRNGPRPGRRVRLAVAAALCGYLSVYSGYLAAAAARLWLAWSPKSGPLWLIEAALLAAAVLAMACGSEALLRAAPAVLLLLLPLAALDSLLLLPDYQLTGLAAVRTAVDWHSAALTLPQLLLPLPLLLCWLWRRRPTRSNCRWLSGGLAAGFIYLGLSLLRDRLLWGDLAAQDRFPVLRSLKSIELGVGLSRVEFLAVMELFAVCALGVWLAAAEAYALTDDLLPRRRHSVLLRAAIILLAAFLGSRWN